MIHVYERLKNYEDNPLGEGTVVLTGSYGAFWMDIKDFEEELDRTNKWLAEYKK